MAFVALGCVIYILAHTVFTAASHKSTVGSAEPQPSRSASQPPPGSIGISPLGNAPEAKTNCNQGL